MVRSGAVRNGFPVAAAYVRVSTPEQSHALQRAAISRAATARGDRELEWFAETRSGRGWERPELDRLRELVFRGGCRKVYVWRLDRLTRRGIRDTLELVDGLRRAGCELISVTEGFDFRQGPLGDLLVAVMAWAAEMEGVAHGERVTAARTRMAAEGRPWGRPCRVEPGSELEAKIVSLRDGEKRSFRSIAMAVKVPQTTVERAYHRAQKTT